MSTRLYFPDTSAGITPVQNGTWAEGDLGFSIVKLLTAKSDTAYSNKSNSGAVVDPILHVMAVSLPLDGDQSVSGTVKCYVGAESTKGYAYGRLEIYVVANDGQSVIGTVLAVADYSTGDEFVIGSSEGPRNKAFANGDSVSSVDASSGDRIVVCLGSTAGGYTSYLRIGDDDPSNDLAEDETQYQGEYCCWIEFSATLAFNTGTTSRTVSDTAEVSDSTARTTTFARATSDTAVVSDTTEALSYKYETRFYLPTSHSYDAQVVPVVNGTWEETASADAWGPSLLADRKVDDDGESIVIWNNEDLDQILFRRFVSKPLDLAVTVGGKVSCQAVAGTASGTAYSQLEVYIVTRDGQTVRGTCLAIDDYVDTAIAAGATVNKKWADGDTLGNVNAQVGDRIVVCLGMVSVPLNYAGYLYAYCDTADPDLPESETAPTDGYTENPWFWLYGDNRLIFSEQGIVADTVDVSDSITAAINKGVSDAVVVSDSAVTALAYGRIVYDNRQFGTEFVGKPSAAPATSWYGYAAAVEGDWVAYGAPGNNHSGYVYMYQWTNGRWVYKQQLTASDATIGDRFGNSLDIDGTSLIVGACYEAGTGVLRGAAYVFTLTANIWTEQQKLEPTDLSNNKYFGNAVSIAGDTAAIGASGDVSNRGAIYVFTRTAGVWTQHTKLQAADGEASDYLGEGRSSVSICKKTGTTIVAGACLHDHGAAPSNCGAAYVWFYSVGSWGQQQEIQPITQVAEHRFGESCHVDGDTLVISGRGASTTDYPDATIFTRSGTTWTAQQQVTYPQSTAWGAGVVARINETNTRLVVSYPLADAGGTNSGVVRFYSKVGTSYTVIGDSYITGETGFGYGLGIDSGGTRVAIGTGFITIVKDSYVYGFSADLVITESLARDDSKTTISLFATVGISDGLAHIADYLRVVSSPFYTFILESSQSLDLSTTGTSYPTDFDGDDLMYVGDPSYSSNVGRVLVCSRSGGTWSLIRTISNPDAPTATYFGHSVSASNGSVLIGAPYKTVGAYTSAGVLFVYRDEGATFEQELQMGTYGRNTCYVGWFRRAHIVGDQIVAGAYVRNKTSSADGCIHYWTRSGTVWTEGAEIASPVPVVSGGFGTLVGFDGTRILAGEGANFPNVVWTLNWSGSAWQMEQAFTYGANDAPWNLDINGSTLAIGVPGSNPARVDLYLYSLVDSTWVQSGKIAEYYALGFGRVSVCSAGNVVYGATTVLHVYTKDNNERWSLALTLTPTSTFPNAFGLSTAITGTDVDFYVVGSEGNATNEDVEVFHVTATRDTDPTDSVTRAIDAGRLIPDAIAETVDSPTIYLFRLLATTITDACTGSDSLLTTTVFSRTVVDTIAEVADAIDTQKYVSVITLEVDDTEIVVSDSLANAVEFGRVAADTAVTAEQAARATDTVRPVADSASLTDMVTESMGLAVSAIDTCTISDQSTRATASHRPLVLDQVAAIDDVDLEFCKTCNLSDTCTTSDQLQIETQYRKQPVDSITASDTTYTIKDDGRLLTDTNDTSDIAKRYAEFERNPYYPFVETIVEILN